MPFILDFVSFRRLLDLGPSRLSVPAMANGPAATVVATPVTVAVTSLNYEKGPAKFHLNFNCAGLLKRSSTLLQVDLPKASGKGLQP